MKTAYADLVQLTHRFYYYLDEFRYQDLVGLFREDGTWFRQNRLLRGRAEMLAALEERSRTMRIRHVMTNAFLEDETETSSAMTAYMTAYRYDDGKALKAPPVIGSPFRILIVKKRFARKGGVPGGAWQVAESAGTPEFEFQGT